MTVEGVEFAEKGRSLDGGDLTKRGSKPSLTAPNVNFACVTKLPLNCKLRAKMLTRMPWEVATLHHELIILEVSLFVCSA